MAERACESWTRKPRRMKRRVGVGATFLFGRGRVATRRRDSPTSASLLSPHPPTTAAMSFEEDWNEIFRDHPVVKDPPASLSSLGRPKTDGPIELNLNTLPEFNRPIDEDDERVPSGRRQAMVTRDTTLIIAVGTSVRMVDLVQKDNEEAKPAKKYKVRPPHLPIAVTQYSLYRIVYS